MANLFHGSAILSTFQLARGYTPSILSMPSCMVTPEVLEAHMESVAMRAIQKEVHSKIRNVEPHSSFEKGMRVSVFLKTSKQNERSRWVEAWVEKATRHFLKCKRNRRGSTMTVACEHVRIAPKGDLPKDLMLQSLEDEFSSGNESEPVTRMEIDESPETVKDISNANNTNVVCESQQRIYNISREEEKKMRQVNEDLFSKLVKSDAS